MRLLKVDSPTYQKQLGMAQNALQFNSGTRRWTVLQRFSGDKSRRPVTLLVRSFRIRCIGYSGARLVGRMVVHENYVQLNTFLAAALGEIPDRATALAQRFGALKSGDGAVLTQPDHPSRLVELARRHVERKHQGPGSDDGRFLDLVLQPSVHRQGRRSVFDLTARTLRS